MNGRTLLFYLRDQVERGPGDQRHQEDAEDHVANHRRPVTTSINKIMTITPSAPLGNGPQFALCGQTGSTPTNMRIRMMRRIVPIPIGLLYGVPGLGNRHLPIRYGRSGMCSAMNSHRARVFRVAIGGLLCPAAQGLCLRIG